jgi:soluble lytic murein transglycosylase-like protein
MSAPAILAAGNRIAEIQSRLRMVMPARSSFAQALQTAQVETATPAGYQVQAAAMPATTSSATPIGMLGTPIITQNQSFSSPATDAWRDLLPAAGRQWADDIEKAATDAGIDPRLLAAVVWQESGFNADAVSKSGAIGLTQLMPGTAQDLRVDPWDATQNLDGGARFLAWTTAEFGSVALGLAAYNAGPGRVRAAGGIPDIAETQAYVPRVLDYYRQLGGVA